MNSNSIGIAYKVRTNGNSNPQYKRLEFIHYTQQKKIFNNKLGFIDSKNMKDHLIEYKVFNMKADSAYVFISDIYDGNISSIDFERDCTERYPPIMNMIRGISSLHKYSIYHGNLKPENVLYKKIHIRDEFQYELFIGDYIKHEIYFNLVRNLSSYQFMSPEMICNKEISTSTDIWSLGCLIYYIFGKKQSPFNATNQRRLLYQILSRNFKKLHHETSYFINELMEKILIVNPLNRLKIEDIENEINSIYIYIYNAISFCVGLNDVKSIDVDKFVIMNPDNVTYLIENNISIVDENRLNNICDRKGILYVYI